MEVRTRRFNDDIFDLESALLAPSIRKVDALAVSSCVLPAELFLCSYFRLSLISLLKLSNLSDVTSFDSCCCARVYRLATDQAVFQ